MGPCDECLCRDFHTETFGWRGRQGRVCLEKVGQDIEIQHNQKKISGGSQRVGWGSSGGAAEEGPMEQHEKR